jgi:uncharacterized protein (DUF433 family)
MRIQNEYIEQHDGGYYVAGTRVSLDSVVYSFNRGNSPEAIQTEYPLLKRAQIYGALAFYLDHQSEIDDYLAQGRREFESGSVPLREVDPGLWERLERARSKMNGSRS